MKIADLLAKVPQPYRTIIAVSVLVVAAVAGLGLIPALPIDTTDVAAHIEDTDPPAPEPVVEPAPAPAPEPVADDSP